MMRSKFRYSDVEWEKIERFVVDSFERTAVRAALEAAGSRYLLSVFDPGPGQLDELKQIVLKRRDIAQTAKTFRDRLQRSNISPTDLGLGRNASLPLDIPGVTERAARDELDALLRSIGMIVAWSEADKFSFFPKKSSAHKPAKNWLVKYSLQIWQDKLNRPVPLGGGSAEGPTSRYLRASCNPILRSGRDGLISNGEAARRLIAGCMENRI